MNEHSLMELILDASPVVQGVMLILLLMSIMAWAITFAKSYQIRKAAAEAKAFDDVFWQTTELTQLYNQVANDEDKRGSARFSKPVLKNSSILRNKVF